MEWCFKCGISGDRAVLFDAVSDKGVVKICEKCSEEENLPIVKKSFEKKKEPANVERKKVEVSPPKLSEASKSVYERLCRISGMGIKEKPVKDEKSLRQQEELKKVTENNFLEKARSSESEPGLIDNFHWIIMRARRTKHLTQEQIAEAIGEPEAAVKMAEKGKIPKGSVLFIRKLENFLGIKISKDVSRPEKKVDFDPVSDKELTIADLQEMKKKKEEGVFEEKPKGNSRKDLSDKEISDLVFGKKKEEDL